MAKKLTKNGLHTLYHYDNQKSEEGKYKDGKKEGKWASWNSKGEKISEGTYKADKKSGKWIEHTHLSKYEGSYKNDKKDGKWTEISFGDKREEIYYSNGEMNRKIYYYDGLQKRDDKNYVDQYVTWWHRNGQKQKEGHFNDKGSNGEWNHWYENGQLESKGRYEDGTETGKWTYWYDDGQKISEGCYKDRRRDGQWTYWYENGQKSAKGIFTTRQYHCGSIHGEGTKKDGWPNLIVWLGEKEEQKDGKWTYWHANGLKAAEGYYGGDKGMSGGNLKKDISGKWPYGDAVSETISINRFFGNQKTGKWLYWHPNGIKAREEKWSYVHQGRKSASSHSRGVELAQKIGWTYSWHPNGQMALKGYFHEDGFNNDGYKEGEWKRWFANGHIKSNTHYYGNNENTFQSISIWDETYRKLKGYFNGDKVRSGRFTISHSNGKLKMVLIYPFNSVFDDDKDIDKGLKCMRYYYDSGQLQEEQNFHLNKMEGLCKSWHEDGQIRSEAMYKNNQIVGNATNWDMSGNKTDATDFYSVTSVDNFNWEWTGSRSTIDDDIDDHNKEDVTFNYVEYESLMSIFDIRDDKSRKNQMYHGSSSSWLDGQALTDDEKLLGESFWRDIL